MSFYQLPPRKDDGFCQIAVGWHRTFQTYFAYVFDYSTGWPRVVVALGTSPREITSHRDAVKAVKRYAKIPPHLHVNLCGDACRRCTCRTAFGDFLADLGELSADVADTLADIGRLTADLLHRRQ